jgi:hypothetical protein
LISTKGEGHEGHEEKFDWLKQLVEQSGLDPHKQTVELMRHLSQHYAKSQMK